MSSIDSIRNEIIMRSAERRLDTALREFRRQVFGDEHYMEELRQDSLIDIRMRLEPAPAPEVRKKLKRWWGWGKRGR